MYYLRISHHLLSQYFKIIILPQNLKVCLLKSEGTPLRISEDDYYIYIL